MTALPIIPMPDFFENFSEPVAITNSAGEIIFTNTAFINFTGYNHSDIPTTLSAAITKATNSSGTSLTTKSNDAIEVNIKGTAIALADNSQGTVYLLLDNKDVKALEKKLERTTEELEQLAYVASHDLQEPLRTITSYIQLVQKSIDKGNVEAVGDFMKFVIDGAGRMQGLISDLLQYSRITKKGNPYSELDLNGVLKITQAQLAAKINESGATIMAGDLPKLYADSAQIGRLFSNVLDNALKFRSPNRKLVVDISVQDKGDEYLFAVKDNGLGLEEKFYSRIFVIFQRLHARGEFEGTGLGLAVAKKIVERHGGEMWVESEKEAGSTFYFTLKKNIPQQ